MRFTSALAFGCLLASSTAASQQIQHAVNEQAVAQGYDRSIKNIAIIGAGAGGSSTAYHLSQYCSDAGIQCNITVFERGDMVGGRTTTTHIWDDPTYRVEVGASIFVDKNLILHKAVKDFGLDLAGYDFGEIDQEQVVEQGETGGKSGKAKTAEVGIWNGEEFVYTIQQEPMWRTIAKLFYNYGYSVYRTQSLMKETVNKFLTMYEPPIFPWSSLSEAVLSADLQGAVASTGEQFLKEHGINDRYAKEIVQPSTRVNYAQNLPLIHGLETMVCMAAEGAMQVKDGNWQIFDQMLKRSGAHVWLEAPVRSMSKDEEGLFQVEADSIFPSSLPSGYDAVVITTPYQFANVSFDPQPRHIPDKIPYVQLHVTLFSTPFALSPSFFNLPRDEPVPLTILTTLSPGDNPGASPQGVGKAGFFSISRVRSLRNPHAHRHEYVYKIFSPMEITDQYLQRLLGLPKERGITENEVTWTHRRIFNSYPYEYPRVTFEEVKLDEGLWYTSGIESFISTMETSALSGKNVARLIVDEWKSGMPEGNAVVEEFGQEELKMAAEL